MLTAGSVGGVKTKSRAESKWPIFLLLENGIQTIKKLMPK